MKILAVDPGSERSALLIYDTHAGICGLDGKARKLIPEAAIYTNDDLRVILPGSGSAHHGDHLVVEQVESYGMPVGREVFSTVFWSGRFVEAWRGLFTLLPRREIKLHLCGSARAKDSNVRAALIDRFGPPGTKAAPGKTYGLKGDLWSALAVAVTYADRSAPGIIAIEER